MKKVLCTILMIAIVSVLSVLIFSGCAAGTLDQAEGPAGFWLGLWHGIISVIAFVIGLFSDSVRVYEVNNTGGWYDFGFLFGVICVWGGGCYKGGKKVHSHTCKDEDWDEIGRKVEKKVMRKVRDWADASEGDDMKEVERKVEEKLKRKIRKWAEKD